MLQMGSFHGRFNFDPLLPKEAYSVEDGSSMKIGLELQHIVAQDHCQEGFMWLQEES